MLRFHPAEVGYVYVIFRLVLAAVDHFVLVAS